MRIKEEIEILENALKGALLVPSECGFVSTQVIKICLDTLKTYESWENLTRYEIEKEVRAKAFDEYKELVLSQFCLYCNQEACEGGMIGTIQECQTISMLRDVLNDIQEELKGEKNEFT